MAKRVWKWSEIREFLDAFDLTENGFSEAVAIRQSTVTNVIRGIEGHPKGTTTPREQVRKRLELGMSRFRHCGECGMVLLDGKPYAKPADQARKDAQEAS
jgi:hypothetical protein